MRALARIALPVTLLGVMLALLAPMASAGQQGTTKQVFKVRGNVTEIATSGRRVVFVQQLERWVCDRVVVWEPLTKKAHRMPKTSGCAGGSSTGEGIYSVAIAGKRVSWVNFAGGNLRAAEISTARLGKTTPEATSFGYVEHETDARWSTNGQYIGDLYGVGSGTDNPWIAWNTWTGCFFEPGAVGGDCTPPDELIPAAAETVVWNERFAFGRPQGEKTVMTGPDALWVSAAASKKFALQSGPIPPGGPNPRPPAPSEAAMVKMILPAIGSTLSEFSLPAGTYYGKVLDETGNLYVVIRDTNLEVYKSLTGEFVTSYPVTPPANIDKQRFELTSAQKGLASYVSGKRIYVVRLSDGASFSIKPKRAYAAAGVRSAVDAKLVPKALVYSHNVAAPKNGVKTGRVVWLPMKTVIERLNAS